MCIRDSPCTAPPRHEGATPAIRDVGGHADRAPRARRHLELSAGLPHREALTVGCAAHALLQGPSRSRMPDLDPLRMYRLPWSLTDNPIAWLEPTQACNLACDGCYRQNVKAHKSLEQVEEELATFARLRNVDGYSIAGGDPLLHQDLARIVSRVKAMGRK